MNIKPKVLVSSILSLSLLALLTSCTTVPPQAVKTAIANPIKKHDPASSFASLRNPTRPFSVTVKSPVSLLKIGRYLQLKLTSMTSGYASLYAVNTSGKVVSLLENKRISGGQTLLFPDQVSPTMFRLAPPAGKEQYILLVTRQPLQWLSVADRLNNNLGLVSLNITKQQLINRLKQVVSRLPDSDWNMDYIQLNLVK
jgi:hypothetical protein